MPYQNVTCHHGIYKQEHNVRGDSFEKKNSMSGGQLILNLWTWMSSCSLFCLVRAMGIKQLTDMYHMTSELFVYANNSLSCSIYSHTTLINLGMFGVDRFDAILPPGTVRIIFFPSVSIFIHCPTPCWSIWVTENREQSWPLEHHNQLLLVQKMVELGSRTKCR